MSKLGYIHKNSQKSFTLTLNYVFEMKIMSVYIDHILHTDSLLDGNCISLEK